MRGMLAGGVALAPGPYEVMFPSLAHGEAELERTLEVFGEVARSIAAGPC